MGITVKIGGDTSKLQTTLKGVNSEFRKAPETGSEQYQTACKEAEAFLHHYQLVDLIE